MQINVVLTAYCHTNPISSCSLIILDNPLIYLEMDENKYLIQYNLKNTV